MSSNQWKGSGGGLCRGDSRGEIDARCREKRSQSVANGVQRKQEKRRTAGTIVKCVLLNYFKIIITI